ncbi:MAG TPA: chemotaxis protein CheD [Polyangia bacterium]|nr:chemotaxis protein CheD [Polyangia bacterium]
MRVAYLLPAGISVVDGESPHTIMTILGSCVSVCLWDRRGRGGGMNHYLLPRRGTGGQLSPRYGDVAIPALVRGLVARGSAPEDLRAKIFGGAHVVPGGDPSGKTLGAQNVEVALELLAADGVQILSDDVGGKRGRKLAFNPVDGTALVWRL